MRSSPVMFATRVIPNWGKSGRIHASVLAASRTRSLMKGAPQLVNVKNKPPVISLREIAAGRVRFNRPSIEVVVEYIEEVQRANP